MPSKLMLLDRVKGREIQKAMVQNLENGVPVDMAVRIAGISSATHYAWLKRGEDAWDKREAGGRLGKGERACVEYLEKIRRAEAEAVSRNALLIQVAARDHWQAAAWYLERRYPDVWGRKDRQEISGPGGAPLAVKADLMHQLMREAEAGWYGPEVVDDSLPAIESMDDVAYITDGRNDNVDGIDESSTGLDEVDSLED